MLHAIDPMPRALTCCIEQHIYELVKSRESATGESGQITIHRFFGLEENSEIPARERRLQRRTSVLCSSQLFVPLYFSLEIDMLQVQNIACTNNAGFVMNFDVQTASGLKTNGSGNYPINQHRVIDLGNYDLAEGTEMWPVVHAILGRTHSGEPHVQYAKNGQTATYEVKGGTLNYSVKLVG